MRQATHCARCGRKRGDGRRDRGWLYWLIDVRQRRGPFIIGPVHVPVACCPECYRVEIEPLLDAAHSIAMEVA